MAADPAQVAADAGSLSQRQAPRPRSHWGFALLLGALSMVSPFSIDTFFPSFHAITAEFHLTPWEIQQTLTAYLVPLAFMSLIQGPLSDSVGRRPVIVFGLMIYSIASLGCAVAPGFAALLAFRVVQGMTAGVGTIVGRAVIRDLHEGAQAQKLMSLVVMVFAFAPAVAPIVGGWIHVTLGWRAVFGFMVMIGARACTPRSSRATRGASCTTRNFSRSRSPWAPTLPR
jgi:MFS transporter, DHA1 family, multidrug resistance protein